MSSVQIVDAQSDTKMEENPQFELFQMQATMDLIPFNAVAETIRLAEVVVSDALVEKLLEPIRTNGISPKTSSTKRNRMRPGSFLHPGKTSGMDLATSPVTDDITGITFEQFGKILALARAKQPTEEMLISALRPLEEQKIYDDGEIGAVINGEKLREFLQTYGDVLSDDEMKEFMDEFNSGKKTELLTDELAMMLVNMD